MYMPDLSSYQYHHCNGLRGVRPIGWLSSEHAYAKGRVSAVVVAKLTYLAVLKSINFMRGYHRCEFCPDGEVAVEARGAVRMLGSAEIWVPGEGCLYAAPNLIVHYVSSHGYQPPEEYVRAVETLDVDEWAPPEDYVWTHRTQE